MTNTLLHGAPPGVRPHRILVLAKWITAALVARIWSPTLRRGRGPASLLMVLLSQASISPAAPEIRLESSEPALRAGEVFYTDQEVSIVYSVDRAWGRGFSAVLVAPDGSTSPAEFGEDGRGRFTMEAGKWTQYVRYPNERSFTPFTARLLEDLVDRDGNPRRDANGSVMQRTVAEKSFLVIRRRAPIRGAIRIDPSDVLSEGQVARVRVALGEGAFANRIEPVDYRVVLVRLGARISGLLSAERAVEAPFRDPGESSFDHGVKAEWPILSADWRTELKLDLAPGAYELRVRDARGWIYDRKRLTVVFPNPKLSGIAINHDPAGSELLDEKTYSLSVHIDGSKSASLIRSEDADPRELEAQSGDPEEKTWVGVAGALKAGSYQVIGDDGLLLGLVPIGKPEDLGEADLVGARQAATAVVPSVTRTFEAGKTISVSIDGAADDPLTWLFELRKAQPEPVEPALGIDLSGLDLEDLDEGDPDAVPDDLADAGDEVVLGSWRMAPGKGPVRIKTPELPGEYDLIGRQEKKAGAGDDWGEEGPATSRMRIKVEPSLREEAIRIRLLSPVTAPGNPARPTQVLWPWTSGFHVEVEVTGGALLSGTAPLYTLLPQLVRLQGTLPGGARTTEEVLSLDSVTANPRTNTYSWSVPAHYIEPGEYDLRLLVRGPEGVAKTAARAPFRVTLPDLRGAVKLLGEPKDDPTALEFEIDPSRLNGAAMEKLSLAFVRASARLPGGVVRYPQRASGGIEEMTLDSRKGRQKFVLPKPFDYEFARYEVWLEGDAGCFLRDCRRVVLAKLDPGNARTYHSHLPEQMRASLALPSVELRELNQPPRTWPPDKQEIPAGRAVAHAPDPESRGDQQRDGYPFLIAPASLCLVHGHHPLQPVAGQPLRLAYRVVNLPDLASGELELHFGFFDPDGGQLRIKAIDDCCKARDDGSGFDCAIGALRAGDFREIEFSLEELGAHGLEWAVEVRRDGEPSEMWNGTVKPPPRASLANTFVLEDQTGQVAPGSEVFAHPYPSPAGSVNRLRHIFVVGKSLPQKPGDEFDIRSPDSVISYTLLAYPDTENIAHRELYERGWAEARRWLHLAPGQTPPAGLQGLLLRATLAPGVLPGEKSLTIADQAIEWDLRFGGLRGQLDFVRGAVHREYEALETAYSPERIRVRVETSDGLPVAELPVLVHQVFADGSKEDLKLTAQPDPTAPVAANGYPRVFTSNPIRLIDKGRSNLSPPPRSDDVPLVVRLSARGPTSLRAEVDPAFITRSFEVPIAPREAAITISVSPGQSTTTLRATPQDWAFKSALKRAASLANQPVTDWDSITTERTDQIKRYVLLKFFVDKTRTKDVTIGHHAAMLLLRDTFVGTLEDQAKSIAQLTGDPIALKSYLEAMRPHALQRSLPINRLKVKGPDGSAVEYGFWVLPHDDEFLMRHFGKSAEEISAWRIDATREALGRLSATMMGLIAEARAIEDRDVKGLLKLTGFGFEALKHRLIPRLMTLRQEPGGFASLPRLYWVPDQAARSWVNDIAPLAQAAERINREADQDNKLLLAGAALASVPVMMGGTTGAMIASLGMDAASLGVSSALEFYNVYQSQVEIDFSQRAAVVIGFQRNDEALRKAKSWLEGTVAVGVQAYLTYLNVLGVNEEAMLAWFRSAPQVAKGARATRALQVGGINSLREIERRHAALFALRAKTKELSQGARSLSHTERAAIEAVDAAMARTATGAGAPASETAGTVIFSDLVMSPMQSSASFTRAFDELITLPADLRRSVGRIQFVRDAGSNTWGLDRLEDHISTNWRLGRSTPGEPAGVAVSPDDLPDTVDLMSLEALLEIADKISGRALGPDFAGRVLFVGRSAGVAERIPLGEFFGGGSFTAALQKPIRAGDTFPQVVKVTLRRPEVSAAAELTDELGLARFRSIPSEHIRVARHVRTIEVGDVEGHAQYISRVVIEENLGRSAGQMLQHRAARVLTPEEQTVYVEAMRDINRAGYFWPENKTDNFGFLRENGQLKLTILDPGGLLRVRGATPAARAAMARRLQSYVNGPIEDVIAEFRRLGNTQAVSGSRLVNQMRRRELLVNHYSNQVADLDDLGVASLKNVPFNPASGEQLSDLATRFRIGNSTPPP